jgi:hypothetical protein
MADNSVHFPKYSIQANTASNHSNRLFGSSKSSAGLDRVHELAPGESILECARLVVLVPAVDIQETRLAQQVWQLASPHSVPVLLLGIARDYETETALLRCLASLAAFTRDRFVKVETRILQTSSWVSALREVIQPGDVILSHVEQQVRKGLFQDQPLSAVLARSIQSPVYMISGYCTKDPRRISEPLRKAFAWVVLLLILAGFIGLDASVVGQVSGYWQQVLLTTLVIIEIGSIWLWNAWAG